MPNPFFQSNNHRPITHALRGIGLAVCLGSTTPAFASQLDSLLANSPFGSPPPPEAPPAPATNELELRTVLVDGRIYAFSIYELSSKKARWLRLGEKGGPILARDYNAEKGTLIVEYKGHPLTLSFGKEQIDLSNLASDSAGRSPFTRKPPAPIAARPPATVPAISASEANRLGKVAELLRALRQQTQPPPTSEASGSNGKKS